MNQTSTYKGPTQLWQHLGDRPGKPYIPLPWHAEAFSVVRIPWPGLDRHNIPYPTIFCFNCGRRAGKTTIAEKLMWLGMTAPDDQFGAPTVRVTADTEEHGRKIWDKFIWHCQNTPLSALVKDYSKDRERVVFHNDADAQLLSANNPAALSGDGVTLWLVDEAQYLTQAAWDNLFPSTAERNGIICLFGVSEEGGPFQDLCLRGDDPQQPEYKRLVYPTSANPYVPKWRIEFARRTLSPAKFDQLYLARWTGELGKIFRNITTIKNDKPILEAPEGYFYTEKYNSNNRYYGGLDLGRLSDWTVITIWNRQGELVAWDRFSIIDWELQTSRCATISKAYGHPLIKVDTTGIGDPVFDDLTAKGLSVDGYQISTNVRKRQLVDEFAIRVGAGNVSIPNIPILLEEMNLMEAKKSKVEGSHVVLYSAPSGRTDDFVLSCSLAFQLIPRPPASIRDYMQASDTPDNYESQASPWDQIA